MQKGISIKNFCWRLEGHCRKEKDPHPEPNPHSDPLVTSTDPRIRIRTRYQNVTVSQIPNTGAFEGDVVFLYPLDKIFLESYLCLDGVAFMPKSPGAWCDLVESLLRLEDTHIDPFSLFLRLFVLAAQYWANNGAAAKVCNTEYREQLELKGLHALN